MAEITLDTIVLGGFLSSPRAAVAGDFIQNDGANKGRIFLLVKNGATEADVTAASPTTCDQGSTHNETVTCVANETTVMGPYNPNRFNDAAGKVQLTYTNTTTITVEALVLPLA